MRSPAVTLVSTAKGALAVTSGPRQGGLAHCLRSRGRGLNIMGASPGCQLGLHRGTGNGGKPGAGANKQTRTSTFKTEAPGPFKAPLFGLQSQVKSRLALLGGTGTYKGGVWAVGATSLLRLQHTDALPAQRDTHDDLDKNCGLGSVGLPRCTLWVNGPESSGPWHLPRPSGVVEARLALLRPQPTERHTRGPPVPASETKRWHHTCMDVRRGRNDARGDRWPAFWTS